MTGPTRRERHGIEFPDAAWTSFDRYDRYGAIARCVRSTLGESPLTVLDVGDVAGYLRLFAGDLRLVGVDVVAQADRLPGAVPVVADGGHLPFPDESFDAVVSSDVLEHVHRDHRAEFLDELRRVSRDLVVIAAPFDTDGVAGVEEMIRRFALLVTGHPQEQLEEHREHGLPDLDATVESLALHGAVAVGGNGNLWDWLELMLVKHQLLARPALQPMHDGIDTLYNLSLAGRAAHGPYYRHVVAARRSGEVELGELAGPSVPAEVMAGILSAVVSATDPESTRQDVVPSLDDALSRLAALEAALDGLRAQVAMVASEVGAVRTQSERVGRALDLLAGPLRRFRRASNEAAPE